MEITVKYEHYRVPHSKYFGDEWAAWVSAARHPGRHGVAYRYFRGVSKWKPGERGGYTICYLLGDENEVVAADVAECSPEDNFNYAIGRDIALGRARKALALGGG